MSKHVLRRDVIGNHQVCNEVIQRSHLGGRGPLNHEVTDHADTDAEFVKTVVGGLGMRADLLLGPAGDRLPLGHRRYLNRYR